MQNDGSEAYDNTTNQSGIHVEEKRERANNNLSLTKSQHKANPKKKGKKLVKLPVHRQIRPIPLNRTNTTSDKNTKSIHEGSSLGPILNHVSSFNFSSISCIKRRTGLVRRTHSPLTTLSPTTKCITQFVSTRSGTLAMPYANNMGSKFVPNNEEFVKPIIPRPACSEVKSKKRKRCQSPKSGKRSRSRSPAGRRGCQENSLLKSNDVATSAAVKVKIVSPTVRGVAESARLLRNGMFSFPTETMYTLVSFIEFRRRTKNKPLEDDNKALPCQWQSLLDFKLIADINKKERCYLHRPILYVHSPTYAHNYVSFSKVRTFVYKHPQQDHEKSSERKFSAVAFSESHEVMNRLSSAFWPGPVTIFAPVKKIRSRTSSLLSNPIENIKEASFDSPTKSSCASLTSLTSESESSDEQPPNLSSNEDEDEGLVSMLPMSALVSSDDLIGNQESDSQSYYVGMRCPSHPLARRVLSEVYENKDASKSPPTRKGRNRIPGAVMGFSASILDNGSRSYSCKDVCSNLISIKNQNHSPPCTKPVVHVMNGEDRREMFCVPAGQYSQNSEISMVIDTPNRTVHIIQKTQEKANEVKTEFAVGVNDVVKALLFQPKAQHSTVTSRAITSVLHKWNVNEIRN